MSRMIKATPECLADVRLAFEDALQNARLAGNVSFTKSFGTIDRKASVFFSEIAWLKMCAIIREFDQEVAWHGVVQRGVDTAKDEYHITDVLVYPQLVTGTFVDTDRNRYDEWLRQNVEILKSIRMQGHSHVNMGTSPSAVDRGFYQDILAQLDDTMFYIFMIYNKKGECFVEIYDMAKNVLFETADVEIAVLEDNTGVEKFLGGAKKMVCAKPPYLRANNMRFYEGYGAYDDYPVEDGYFSKPFESYHKSALDVEPPKYTDLPAQTLRRKGKRKIGRNMSVPENKMNVMGCDGV